MEYSRDLERIIKHAKETAILLKRPYVCCDILFESLVLTNNLSLFSIFSALKLDIGNLQMISKLVLVKKKKSVRPSGNLSKGVRDILQEMEKIAKDCKEDDCRPEMLLQAMIIAKKKPSPLSFIFEEDDTIEEEMNLLIHRFLRDHYCVSFFGDLEKEEKEEKEEESDLEGDTAIQDMFGLNKILDKYAVNLNIKARDGDFDNLINVSEKERELTEILCRKKKPNVILVGPSGGGKTGVVELLAKTIVNGKSFDILRNKTIYSLDLTKMIGGTKLRGMFEQRLSEFMAEIEKYENIILFIDEIHTLVGAGNCGQEGQLDASNILKPALARGGISCIGATTINEYNLRIKTDAALDRRFEKVIVRPPSASKMKVILPNLLKYYEQEHSVKFLDSFIDNAILYCEKYMANKVYPDKMVDVIDHCGSMAKIDAFQLPREFKELELNLIDKLTEEERKGKDPYLLLMSEIENMQDVCEGWSDKDEPEVSLDNLKRLFDKRIPIILKKDGANKLKKHLNKKLVDKKKITISFIKSLNSASLSTDKNAFKRPNLFAFYGEKESGKSLVLKEIANFLRAENVDVEEIKGSELAFPARILSNKIEDNSLCQKQIFGDSAIFIIDDFNDIDGKCFDYMVDIFKEGEVRSYDGELVDFSNSVFIISLPEDRSVDMGFSGDKKEIRPKVSKRIEKFVTSFRLVKDFA